MEINYDLLKPFNYGGIVLKNRIIFAPTTMGLSKKEYLKKLEAIAAGGCSLMIIGDVPVSKSKMGPSLFSKSGFSYYQEITQTIHKYDCKVCAQLHQNDTKMSSILAYLPKILCGKIKKSEIKACMNEGTSQYISSISTKQVKQITDSFGLAAQKAVEAGFDMIQVHGDRMCGSFSSSLFNRRNDLYGNSIENRARFAIECVQSIRQKLPEICIDYKLCIRQENPHYGNAGILEDEISTFVPLLEQAGVTSFHVTLANHSKLEDAIPPYDHPYFKEEGCFLKFAQQVRKYTQLPICAVGGFSHPDYIERVIQDRQADCIAMSRQLIADPNWVNKLQQQKTNTIHWCKRCNKKCLNGMYEHKGVHCIYDK